MANLFKYFADLLHTDYGMAGVYTNEALLDANIAWTYWYIPDDHSAIQYSLASIDWIIEALDLLSGNKWGAPKDYLFMTHALSWEYTIEEPPTVTWQAIAEAWLVNDFECRSVTIAFIDRMRQLLWTEPYSAVFAARPEDKEIPE